MNIGHRIKVLRERSGKSQEAIAKALRISRSTLAGIEQGKRKNPRLNTLLDIVKECGSTMSDLFPGSTSMQFDDGGDKGGEHAEIYRKLREVLRRSHRKERVLLAVVNELYAETRLKAIPSQPLKINL